MAESNIKEMIVDDINDQVRNKYRKKDDDKSDIPWYLVEKDSTIYRFKDALITLIIVY